MTRARFLAIAGVGASILLAAGAPAQTPPPPPADDIVVQARERETIEAFVRDIVDPGPTEQLARWDGTVCSGIIGLGRDQAEVVNSRIAAATTLAGLAMGGAGCRPNVLTIVTPQAGTLAAGIAKRFPVTLGRDGRGRVTQFARSTLPVRWISRTSFDTGDGRPMPGKYGFETPQLRLPGSRLTKATRATMAAMLIIVDAKDLDGMTLGTLGDYLAMVALARPKPEARPPSQSILAHFEDRAIGALTDYDRRYLTALYKAPASGGVQAQAASIRTRMKDND